MFALFPLELAALGTGQFPGGRIRGLGCGRGTPSLYLSPGGGEIGIFGPGGEIIGRFETCTCGWRVSGGEIGIFGPGGEIMCRSETCPYGCWVSGGEIGIRGGLMFIRRGIGAGLYRREVRLRQSGELFEVLEVTPDVFEGVFVVLGRGGRLRAVVTVVATAAVFTRGAATTGGAVLLRHLAADEHHQE